MVIRGSPGAWSVASSRIVGVFPVRDGVQVVTVGNLVFDPTEQLVLAVETAIRPVRLILGAITLMRRDLDERYAQLCRDIMCRTALLEGQAWRYTKQGKDAVDAQRPRSERK